MKDYIQKIKSLYEKATAGKISYEKNGINPSKDWRLMLTVSFISLCGLALVAFYFYTKVERGEIFFINKGEGVKELQIDTALLKKIVGDIKNREDLVVELKTTETIPSDPSF